MSRKNKSRAVRQSRKPSVQASAKPHAGRRDELYRFGRVSRTEIRLASGVRELLAASGRSEMQFAA